MQLATHLTGAIERMIESHIELHNAMQADVLDSDASRIQAAKDSVDEARGNLLRALDELEERLP